MRFAYTEKGCTLQDVKQDEKKWCLYQPDMVAIACIVLQAYSATSAQPHVYVYPVIVADLVRKTRRGPGLLAEGESARQRQRTEVLSAATRIALHASDCDVGLPNLAAEFHRVVDTGGWRKGFHEGTQSSISPQALGRDGNL